MLARQIDSDVWITAQNVGKQLNVPAWIIVSQWAFEQPNGVTDPKTKNNNLGGIKWGSRTPPEQYKNTLYRVYGSIADYGIDYIASVIKPNFPDVYNTSDVDSFVYALKHGKGGRQYFESSETEYADGIRTRARQIFGSLPVGYANVTPQNISQSVQGPQLPYLPDNKLQYKVDGFGNTYGTLFGRKYRILVTMPGENAFDVSNLHVVFKVTKLILPEQQYSEIVIYNLDALTEGLITQAGGKVLIEAGYESGLYGGIYTGMILQTIREKRNGTDFVLTLICVDGDLFLNSGFSSISYPRGQTMRFIASDIANKASNPIEIGSISESLSQAKLTRGKVVFGMTKDYMEQIARSNGGTFYVLNNKAYISNITDIPDGEIIELNPSSGLIGGVQQTQQGITCRCLINPQIELDHLIHINSELIKETQITLPAVTTQTKLDPEGIYRVIKMTYQGDTRGTNWYIDIDAVTQAGTATAAMLTDSKQTPYAGAGGSG